MRRMRSPSIFANTERTLRSVRPGLEIPLHRLAQLAEVGSGNGVTDRNEHVRAGFHQHTFIHSDVGLTLRFRFVD